MQLHSSNGGDDLSFKSNKRTHAYGVSAPIVLASCLQQQLSRRSGHSLSARVVFRTMSAR